MEDHPVLPVLLFSITCLVIGGIIAFYQFLYGNLPKGLGIFGSGFILLGIFGGMVASALRSHERRIKEIEEKMLKQK